MTQGLSSQILLGLGAGITTLVAGLILIRWAAPWGFIDIPDDRKVHVTPTPRTGGLAMILGCLSILAIATPLRLVSLNLPWQTWLAGAGFMLTGGLDDRFSYKPSQKFLVFLALSALAAWPWLSVVATKTHLPAWTLPGAYVLLTLWFMAVPNALNIEDAINGYMGGFTLIVLAGLAARGLSTGLLIGSLAGFLLLNWPRAKHFMGDAGSFGCGFILAEAILRSGAVDHPWLALAFTAPISLDVAMGLLRRHRLGMGFFVADRSTCPHHVLARTGGNNLIASPLLWLNSTAFVLFATNTLWLSMQTMAYLGILIWFNREALLRGRNAHHI